MGVPVGSGSTNEGKGFPGWMTAETSNVSLWLAVTVRIVEATLAYSGFVVCWKEL
jgi:hypothetical protein